MTASDPVTAYGWTVDHGKVGRISHTSASSFLTVHPTASTASDARADLARCIEDAALLAKVCHLAAPLRRDGAIHLSDQDAIQRLLALLSGDGTDG